ncbi:hypothetical protein AAE02nite_01890 [Adhaeribacter aerolatus]|uniref:DUF3592 domain-containing protein n=1 Tax=Adhaeribacter aerolatus TaxID=670289 RepID=A0A512AS43_9BACT|nr:hypothetical protein [Adhaeribacter aerolatus]GEO02525.1 hypothetical protein AAE02nite_01890 [Adhaeribacter aerolatus]
MSQKAQSVITLLIIFAVIIGALYWLMKESDENRKYIVDTVNRNYEYSKGIITDVKSYKGHSLDVEYIIKGKKYKYSGGWTKNPNNLGEGDSIRFRYSVENPELIITELQNEY